MGAHRRLGVRRTAGADGHALPPLRRERGWLSESEFHDGIAAANLLPGPAAIQLGIYCAWRLRGAVGAVVAGVCFALPGLVIILGLSALFLAQRPALWLQGAAAGAGAAVAAIAVNAAVGLIPASWRRVGAGKAARARWIGHAREQAPKPRAEQHRLLPLAAIVSGGVGGVGALAWVAFKVGALSYGTASSSSR
jgi:chromate transporter